MPNELGQQSSTKNIQSISHVLSYSGSCVYELCFATDTWLQLQFKMQVHREHKGHCGLCRDHTFHKASHCHKKQVGSWKSGKFSEDLTGTHTLLIKKLNDSNDQYVGNKYNKHLNYPIYLLKLTPFPWQSSLLDFGMCLWEFAHIASGSLVRSCEMVMIKWDGLLFIPKVFIGVEIWVLYRLLELFYINLGNPCVVMMKPAQCMGLHLPLKSDISCKHFWKHVCPRENRQQ